MKPGSTIGQIGTVLEQRTTYVVCTLVCTLNVPEAGHINTYIIAECQIPWKYHFMSIRLKSVNSVLPSVFVVPDLGLLHLEENNIDICI